MELSKDEMRLIMLGLYHYDGIPSSIQDSEDAAALHDKLANEGFDRFEGNLEAKLTKVEET